ncbi:MAG: DUF4258 domain-containing protein [Candidatus Micrarchaeaceae archaeon]|jgi:short subunit fatty acids transporter
MKFVYTKHAEKKINERAIDKSIIEKALSNSDEIIKSPEGRLIAHKIVNRKLLRIIYVIKGNSYIIVTAYYTRPSRYVVKK